MGMTGHSCAKGFPRHGNEVEWKRMCREGASFSHNCRNKSDISKPVIFLALEFSYVMVINKRASKHTIDSHILRRDFIDVSV